MAGSFVKFTTYCSLNFDLIVDFFRLGFPPLPDYGAPLLPSMLDFVFNVTLYLADECISVCL